MTYCPPERSPRPEVAQDNSAPRTRVEQQDKPRGGARGRKRRSTTRQIQAKSQQRQGAWSEGGKPNETFRLTRDLDELYGEHRGEQAGTLIDPYLGRTWSAGQ